MVIAIPWPIAPVGSLFDYSDPVVVAAVAVAAVRNIFHLRIVSIRVTMFLLLLLE